MARNGKKGYLVQNQSAYKGNEVRFPTSKSTLHSLNDSPKILGNRNMLDGEPQIISKRGGGAKFQNITKSFPGTGRDIGRKKIPMI